VAGLKNCKDFHAEKNKYFLTELSKIILSKILLAAYSENIFAKISLSPYMFNNYLFFTCGNF